MFLKLSVFIFICVFLLPVIESQKSKNKKWPKSSEEKPDWDTCGFQGYDGPEDDKPHKKHKVRLGVKGPVPSVFTPFTEDGEINYPVIPKYVRYLNKTGATAILVGSLSGECFTMSTCERKQVTEAFYYEAKKYNIKVIAQIGGIELPYVIELAIHAQKLKLAAILILPPIFYKTSKIEVLIWYLTIISKFAPSLPLLYHDYPEKTGVFIKHMREFHIKLTDQVPNYRGMATSFDVALDIADLVRREQEIFVGTYHVASAAFMGFDSTINPVHNAALEDINKILKAVKTGAIKKARTLQLKLNKITAEIVVFADLIPATKAAFEMTTPIKVGPLRPPQRPLTDEERKCIREALENNGIRTEDD